MANAAKKAVEVGDIVSWIGAGKVARIYGYYGKVCTGTVAEIHNDHWTVQGTHVDHKPFKFPMLSAVYHLESLK